MLTNINEETSKGDVLNALDYANIVGIDVLQYVEHTDIIFKQVVSSLEITLSLARKGKAF